MQEQYRKDVTELETRFKSTLQKKENKLQEATDKYNDLMQKARDIKELLKLAIKKEAEKEALAEELKEIIKKVATENKMIKEEFGKQKMKYEKALELLGEENKILRSNVTKTDSATADNLEKLRKGAEIISEKDGLLSTTEKQLNETKEKLKECLAQLEEIKEQKSKFGSDLEQQISSKDKLLEEAGIKLTTKDKMLEDKNEEIGQLKQTIQELEQELSDIKSNKDQYKEYYEEKLKQVAFHFAK